MNINRPFCHSAPSSPVNIPPSTNLMIQIPNEPQEQKDLSPVKQIDSSLGNAVILSCSPPQASTDRQSFVDDFYRSLRIDQLFWNNAWCLESSIPRSQRFSEEGLVKILQKRRVLVLERENSNTNQQSNYAINVAVNDLYETIQTYIATQPYANPIQVMKS